jgi:hypothetical protein
MPRGNRPAIAPRNPLFPPLSAIFIPQDRTAMRQNQISHAEPRMAKEMQHQASKLQRRAL